MVHLQTPAVAHVMGTSVQNNSLKVATAPPKLVTTQGIVEPIVHSNELFENTYENGGWGFWYWFCAILLFAIFVGLIIWAIYSLTKSSDEETKGLNENCEKNSQCDSGLVCSNNKCKVQVGGHCSADDDCAAGASGCVKGFCVAKTSSKVGTACNDDCPCGDGLICENMICKVPIGGNCSTLTECVSDACFCSPIKENSSTKVCASTLGSSGDPCPCEKGFTCLQDTDDNGKKIHVCKRNTGEPCDVNEDCLSTHVCDRDSSNGHQKVCVPIPDLGEPCTFSGYCMADHVCGDSTAIRRVVEDDTKPNDYEEDVRFRFLGNGIQDLFLLGTTPHILLGSGDIIVDGDKTRRTVKNKVMVKSHKQDSYYCSKTSENRMTRIVNFGGYLYGLDKDKSRLHIMFPDETNPSTVWNWFPVTFLDQENIIHLDTTNDADSLWIQSSYKYTSKTKGHLYKFSNDPSDPYLETTKILESGIIRTYGRNTTTYVDHDRNTNKALVKPSSKSISGVTRAKLNDAGRTVVITESEANKGRQEIRLLEDQIEHFITQRTCQGKNSH